MSRSAPDLAGPYMNEDGDWWVPVEAMSYLAARRFVRGHLYGDDNRLVYKGKEMAWLDSAHEAHPRDEECGTSRHLLAWHFVEEER